MPAPARLPLAQAVRRCAARRGGRLIASQCALKKHTTMVGCIIFFMSAAAGDSVVLEEELPENYEPTEDEILEYASWLGMDVEQEKELFWIAREGLKAPLPEHWKPCKTNEGEIYYFNFATGDSVWDHPCDAYHKKLYADEKKKIHAKLARHLKLVLDPALPLPLHIDLGKYSCSWENGKLKVNYGQKQEGFRKLRRDELMQLMRRLQASPHVILLNLMGHKFGAATMREMAAPIAALSELQALLLGGTCPPPSGRHRRSSLSIPHTL